MEKKIKDICISTTATLADALKQMDVVKRKLLLVVYEDSSFFSLLSIGDIQRAIINNHALSECIKYIIRQDITIAKTSDDLSYVKERMRERRNELMPVLDEKNQIADVIFWEDLFQEKRIASQLNLPVVIMAGGRGSRLRPLTNVIPKPLIPINEKTIIEDIMDRFVQHGCNDFYISVNYKADMIRYYLNQLNSPYYHIIYFEEDKPLGTAGSLTLLEGKIDKTFFVSNCDILIDEDYGEILKYHQTNQNEITLVAALISYPIPYGTFETSNDGLLTSLTEKPELNFKINSGVYIVEPHLLSEIPTDTFFHITSLIEKILERNGRVGVFPISEKSWYDIGSLGEYRFHN